MPKPIRKIIKFLAVGYDNNDNHTRITQGNHIDIISGSEENHACLQNFAMNLEKKILDKNIKLNHLTTEEIFHLIQKD